MEANHLIKVQAVIDSCLTYEQLRQCLSFLDNRFLCRTNEDARLINELITFKRRSMQKAERMSIYKEALMDHIREEPDISEINAKEFGLWLGNNIKKNKGKSIDDLYDEYKNQLN